MTPLSLLETLQALPSDLPLVFRTEEGAIGDGYHVTELKLAQISSIDCGGRLAAWTEAALQLLDGNGGGHMPVGKFAAILDQSIARVKGLGDCPVHVEFAHGNKGMRLYDIALPELLSGQVEVALTETRANCKPALDYTAANEVAGCCGSGAAAACCG